ncbi:hypothetical protein R3I94_019347 [Phoxinus phoxinus]
MAEAALAFCCPVCLDMPKNPVTIPCGHSYCMNCITGCWDQEDPKGIYSCPQCRQTFSPRPVLRKNTMLADLAEKLRNMMPEEATLCYAELDDVPCDVCTGIKKYKAVKSCLVCVVSFCELHLKPHLVSAAYRGHKLVTAFCKVKEMICSTHKKPLEVYCQTDQQFVCLLCVLKEHREHDVVSVATERQTKQIEIEEMQSNSKKRIQRGENELTELITSVGTTRRSAQEAVDDMEKLCTDLTDSIKTQCNQIIRLIRDQEETAVSQAEKFQEQLQQEISELQQRDANIQMLLTTEDDFMFLQIIMSLSNPQKYENSPRVHLSRHGLFEQVRKSISDRKDKITDLLEENCTQLSEKVRKVQIFQPPKNREEFLLYSCGLTLDLKTAHNNLHFSDGNAKLMWGAVQSNPDHPERFDSWWQVLNKEGLTGCWYWEVEWSGTVIIAVSYKSIVTKGPGTECGFGHNDQSWCLCCTSAQYSFWHGNTETRQLEVPSSSRVGVYLDHSAGTLAL